MTGYTVIDLETTGLFPKKHDRIVEIGIVALSDEGEVEDEWTHLGRSSARCRTDPHPWDHRS